jgi:hypothetical protein
VEDTRKGGNVRQANGADADSEKSASLQRRIQAAVDEARRFDYPNTPMLVVGSDGMLLYQFPGVEAVFGEPSSSTIGGSLAEVLAGAAIQLDEADRFFESASDSASRTLAARRDPGRSYALFSGCPARRSSSQR